MSDTTPDRAWAGRTLFPRSAAELRSTTICPACLVPLTAVVCTSCGLDLRHPAAADLAAASVAVADALDARLDLIGRIRRDTAAAATAATAAPAPAAPAAAPTAAAAVSEPTLSEPAVSEPAPVQPPSPAASGSGAARGRSGIQIALIVVGISLLSVFAVFGLVYAFVTYGNTVRMAIITGGTLATMVAAGVLARRGLRSTGEGVAALGTVMLALDAWALRLNDPEGLGASDPELYWGAALLIVAATAAVWARTNRLGVPGVVGAGLLPIGAGLLTLHLVEIVLPGVEGAGVMAGALAALIVSVGSPLAAPAAGGTAATRTAARIVARLVGAVAGIIALGALLPLDPTSRYAPVVAGVLLAAAALLPLAAPRTLDASAAGAFDRLTLVVIGGGSALAAIVGATVAAARFGQDRVIVSAPLIAAVLVSIVFEQAWRRGMLGPSARLTHAAGTLTAATLAALGGGLASIVGIGALLEAMTQGLEVLPLAITDPVASAEPATVAALAALALSLGLIAAHWASLGLLRHRARALTALGAGVLVALVPLLPAWWLVMTVLAVLAVGGALAVRPALAVASADARRALLVLVAPLSAGAALAAWAIGWAVPRGATLGLAIALVAIGVGRTVCRRPVVRTTAVAGAAALTLGSTAPLVAELTRGIPADSAFALSGGSAVIAVAAIIAAAAQLGGLSVLERRAALAVAAVAAVVAALAPRTPYADEVVAHGLAVAALALVAVRGDRVAQLVARILLPLAVARAAQFAAVLAGATADLVAVVALGSLVVVAAVALATTGAGSRDEADAEARSRTLQSAFSGPSAGRRAVDASTLVVTAILLVTAGATDGLWLALLVGAVVVLVVATSRDGLVGARSPRRHLGWVALALGTAALWTRLATDDVTAIEPYTLPLAGALLLIATAAALVGHRRATPSRSTAGLAGAALLVALVPSAVQSTGSDTQRALIVAAVGAVVLIGGMLASRRTAATLPGLAVAGAGAAAAALAVGALAHAVELATRANGDVGGIAAPLAGPALVHAALVVGVPAVLAVVAEVLSRRFTHDDESGSARDDVPGSAATTASTEHRLRDGIVAALLGSGAISAAGLALSGAVPEVETVSASIALAAVAVGALRLARTPSARSWPWLAPGLVLLLAPSLLAIDGAGEPLWRAVAIGVVAASVFAVGLWLRLQAPFVLGGTALLIHLLVQSWPLLEQVGRAVEWWLWLGLAGVIVVALAARYERRLQNARDIARRISDLR